MWAPTMLFLLVGCAGGGEARALPTDSLQIEAHAASPESVDGWQPVAPNDMPAGMADTLWISPKAVMLSPESAQRLTLRVENGRPVLTLVPAARTQDALRALLRDTPGTHLVVRLNGTVRYATQVLSIEGTARSLKLANLSPNETATLVRRWQHAHQAPSGSDPHP